MVVVDRPDVELPMTTLILTPINLLALIVSKKQFVLVKTLIVFCFPLSVSYLTPLVETGPPTI